MRELFDVELPDWVKKVMVTTRFDGLRGYVEAMISLDTRAGYQYRIDVTAVEMYLTQSLNRAMQELLRKSGELEDNE